MGKLVIERHPRTEATPRMVGDDLYVSPHVGPNTLRWFLNTYFSSGVDLLEVVVLPEAYDSDRFWWLWRSIEEYESLKET